MLLLNDRETVKNYFSKNGFIKCIILITEFHNIRAKNGYLHSSQRRSQHQALAVLGQPQFWFFSLEFSAGNSLYSTSTWRHQHVMQCTSVLGTAKEVRVTPINSHIYYDEQEPQQGSGTIPSFNFCKTGQWCVFFFIIT